MSKKNRGRGGYGGQQTPSRTQGIPPARPANPALDVGKAIASAKPDSKDATQASDTASEVGISTPDPAQRVDEPPKGGEREALVLAYRSHLELRDLYDAAKAEVDRKRAKLDDDERDLAIELLRLQDEDERLSTIRTSLDEQVATLRAHASELDVRELDIARRETDLAAGRLAKAYETYVAPLERRRSELFEQFAVQIGEAQETARASLQQLQTDLLAGHSKLTADLRDRIAEVESQRQQLELAQADVDAREARVGRLNELIEQQRAALLEDLEEERQEARNLLETERAAFQDYVRQRAQELERVSRRATLVEAWERQFGSTDEMAQHMEGLHTEVERLQSEIARRSTMLEDVEVRRLTSERLELVEKVERLYSELQAADEEHAGLRNQLLTAQADVDSFRSMEATIGSYRDQVAQLRADMENLSKVGEAKTPFRECTRMDADPELQRRQNLSDDETLDLRAFIDRMQCILFQSREGSLSYRKRDLRLFVAGLAMSRLHILEGVSGTGKTTLPIAFARHLGGGAANVAIQAGWRDRQDLLGYFNEFQGNFRESDFLRGVYQAMTPAYRDGVFFVVLDEMNLSKVEQYFADYLKALEDAEGADRKQGGAVPLMDRSDIPLPRNLKPGDSGGVLLPLPDNVWFIGTANQDESTQSFAPKTQSRAHIMELPHVQPTQQEITAEIGRTPYRPFEIEALPYEALHNAFDEAKENPTLRQAAETAEQVFHQVNQAILDLDPSLSLAPRFYRQLKSFIPVLVGSGGTLTVGIDHLICSKVVRRMNERYNIQKGERNQFNQAMSSVWADFGLDDYAGSRVKTMLSARSDR